MKRGLIFGIILVFIIGIVGFGSTEMFYQGDFGGDLTNKVDIEEGWNLVAGLTEKHILSDSEIQKENIEVIWYYSPIQKEYFQIYPELDINVQQDDDDFVLSSGMWIYSNKEGELKYSVPDDMPHINGRQMYSGWNFFALDEYVIGKTMNEIKGNCDYSEIYFYGTEGGTTGWGDLLNNPNFIDNEEWQASNTGISILIKVIEDCSLGASSDGIIPPSLP